MTEGQRRAVVRAVVSLAGKLAERRAHRGSEPGWVRMLSEERRIAVHEVGHAICAMVCEEYVIELTIIPDPEYKSLGHCMHSKDADFKHDPKEPKTPSTRDRTTAAAYAWLLTSLPPDPPYWKAVLATVHTLRALAQEIIERNWLYVSSLADTLERRRTLSREELAEIRSRLMPRLSQPDQPIDAMSRLS